MKKIFLVGYYGYKNVGDELLLYEISNFLKKCEDLEISALSIDSKYTTKKYDVNGISRLKNFSLIKHISNVDFVVYGGGSILQDITSSKSLYYYLGILLIAKFFRKKVIFLGNGFGPIIREKNKILLKNILKMVDLAISRDDETFKNFKQFGIKNVFNGVDCAFLNTFVNEKNDNNILDKYNLVENEYIIVSLRNWINVDKFIDVLKKIFDTKFLEYKIVFISMKFPEDKIIIDKNFEENNRFIYVNEDVEGLLELFSKSKMTIAMRLHSLILSGIFKKPFLAISYDPKVESFCNQTEQEILFDLNNIDNLIINKELEMECKDKVDRFLSNYSFYQKKLEKIIPTLNNLAIKQFDLFLEYLYK